MIKCRTCGGAHWTKNCRQGSSESGYTAASATSTHSPSKESSSSSSTRAGDVVAQRPLVGVFLGDVEYYIRDVLRKEPLDGLAWLFAVAKSHGGKTLLDGSEKPVEGVELPLAFVACPFVLLAEASSAEDQGRAMKELKTLEYLQFKCRCSVKVFALEGPRPEPEWSFVFKHVIPAFVLQFQQAEPHWFLPPDQIEGRNAWPQRAAIMPPVNRVAVVPVYSAGRSLFLFLVQQPECLGQGVWTTVGGAPKHGADGDKGILDTCVREWSEEVQAFPPTTAMEIGDDDHAIQWVVWKANSSAWKSWSNCMPPGSRANSDGMSSTAWLFKKANSSFFASTVGHKVSLIPDAAKVVRKTDPLDRFKLIHTDGLPFVEQEFGAWFRLDCTTGKLFTHLQDAEVRGDLEYTILRSPELRSRLALWCNDEPLRCASEFPHDVIASPEGLRNKLELFKFNMEGWSSEACTKQLVKRVSNGFENDEFHQPYSEEIQALLEFNADPAATEQLPDGVHSVLMAVLLNRNLRESVAMRSAEHLCRSLRKHRHALSVSEIEGLQDRAASASKDLQHRWKNLCS
ncbi:unnamed protein product [Polarella glacialis]|uniref:Nudix hydrolase domain-containing protein n=1 Tax=Polarella glacialis TaxID=89957 RepID=A0A813I1N8_POLGL|nr:unnamed protein product [Polarella glacialis]